MSETKRRGRPRVEESPKTVAADQVIGRTIWNLAIWGFPIRSRGETQGACEVVGLKARHILDRVDGNGVALGPDRIEQIFEKWFKQEKERRAAAHLWPLSERWRYTKESLTDRRPDSRLSIEDYAERLLKNGGQWDGPRPFLPSGDLRLAPKAEETLGPVPEIDVRFRF